MSDIETLIQTKLRVFRIVHLAIVMGSIIYALLIVYVHFYTPLQPTITNEQTLKMIDIGLVIYVAVMIIAATTTRKKMLSSDAIFKRKETSKAPSDEPPFISNYLSALFVVWALFEAITIGGIVLYLSTGKLVSSLIVISIGIVFKLFNGPNRQELKGLANKATIVA